MSSSPNVHSPVDVRPLPEEWVNRLFDRFFVLYGSTKVIAMWEGLALAEVKAAWAEELGRFDANTLRVAMRAIVDSGREWPPTIPEFVAACLQVRRPESTAAAPALPGASGGYTDVETARRNVARIRTMLESVIKRPAMGAKS